MDYIRRIASSIHPVKSLRAGCEQLSATKLPNMRGHTRTNHSVSLHTQFIHCSTYIPFPCLKACVMDTEHNPVSPLQILQLPLWHPGKRTLWSYSHNQYSSKWGRKDQINYLVSIYSIEKEKGMLKAEVLKADVPVSTLFISDARAPRHSRTPLPGVTRTRGTGSRAEPRWIFRPGRRPVTAHANPTPPIKHRRLPLPKSTVCTLQMRFDPIPPSLLVTNSY